MRGEFYEQLAADVNNGHISEERADAIEREYDEAEYLESCRRDAEAALRDSEPVD